MNDKWQIRVAEDRDKGEIFSLLGWGQFRHMHVDWRLPIDWLGSPGFLVVTNEDGRVKGCLIVSSGDGLASWVIGAAFDLPGETLNGVGEQLLKEATRFLQGEGVKELGWLPFNKWEENYLTSWGFEVAGGLESYLKDDCLVPVSVERPLGVTLRKVSKKDLEAIVLLEQQAFAPLWMHSYSMLEAALKQSFSFTLIESETSDLLGYQCSTIHGDRAHLARIMVYPKYQGQGLGSWLLAETILEYQTAAVRQISLNTQVGNSSSKQLYRKFGFYPTIDLLPVWVMRLDA